MARHLDMTQRQQGLDLINISAEIFHSPQPVDRYYLEAYIVLEDRHFPPFLFSG